jgi:hypothetical protein
MPCRGSEYYALNHARCVANTDFPNFAHQAYLLTQLGINALDHNEAATHFTAAVKTIPFLSESAIHSKYVAFAVVR